MPPSAQTSPIAASGLTQIEPVHLMGGLVLEVEIAEPSLYLIYADGAAARFAAAISHSGGRGSRLRDRPGLATERVEVPTEVNDGVVIEVGAPASRVRFALAAALGADERVFGGRVALHPAAREATRLVATQIAERDH